MTPKGRRLVAVLSLLLLLLGAPGHDRPTAVASPAVLSSPDAVVADPRPFSVTVESLAPTAPGPEDTLVVSARVVAEQTLEEVTVRLRVGRALTSRSALARADGLLVPTSTRTGRQPVADMLEQGASRRVTVRVDVDDLRLESLGIHPLQLEVRARVLAPEDDPSAPSGLLTETVQTYLPTFPDPVVPTRLAVVLPLAGPPLPSGDGPAAASADAMAALADEVSPQGRLSVLLEAGAEAATVGVPITWAVDAALLESVQRIAEQDVPGAPAGVALDARQAAAWLERARVLLAASSVLALPYADADVVALVRDRLADEVPLAVVEGRERTAAALDVSPLEGWAWPADGHVTADALEALRVSGTRTVVLDGSAVTRSNTTRITPDAAVALEHDASSDTTSPPSAVEREPSLALTSDTALTALLESGSDAPPWAPSAARPLGAALAVQRMAAEVASITAERPSSGRSVLLAPPRDWDPPLAYARELLVGLAGQPWVLATALEDVAADAEPDSGALSAAARAHELALPGRWVDPIAAARRDLDDFAPVLTEPEPVLAAHRLALLAAASASWRRQENRALGRAVAADAVGSVESLLTSVRVEGGAMVLFTAEEGTIPLTVANQLDQPVRVQVAVDPTIQARVVSSAIDELTVEAGRRRQVDVEVEARTSGQFPVFVQLRTPDGIPLGEPVRVTVRSTAYGRVALIITIGAAAVLVLGAAGRLLRRARRNSRPGATPSPG